MFLMTNMCVKCPVDVVHVDCYLAVGVFVIVLFQTEMRNTQFAQKLESLLHRAYNLQEDFGSTIPPDSLLADLGMWTNTHIHAHTGTINKYMTHVCVL